MNHAPARKLVRWSPPPFGALKSNINAAFFKDINLYGFGMCIRDHEGNFVQAKTMWIDSNLEGKVGEAMGLMYAIRWIIELGFNNVQFEVNSKKVVNELSSLKENFMEFGVIMGHCKRLISSSTNYSAKFIRRQTNKVAHSLARASVL